MSAEPRQGRVRRPKADYGHDTQDLTSMCYRTTDFWGEPFARERYEGLNIWYGGDLELDGWYVA
jgi:hypothetical protein